MAQFIYRCMNHGIVYLQICKMWYSRTPTERPPRGVTALSYFHVTGPGLLRAPFFVFRTMLSVLIFADWFMWLWLSDNYSRFAHCRQTGPSCSAFWPLYDSIQAPLLAVYCVLKGDYLLFHTNPGPCWNRRENFMFMWLTINTIFLSCTKKTIIIW